MKTSTKFRLTSALTAFAVVTTVSGLLPGAVCAVFLVFTSQLRQFHNILPDVLFEDDHYTPKYLVERIIPPVVVYAVALVYLLSCEVFAALILFLVVSFDLFQDTERVEGILDAIKEKWHKM